MAIRGRGRVYTVNSPLWSENNTFLSRNKTRPPFSGHRNSAPSQHLHSCPKRTTSTSGTGGKDFFSSGPLSTASILSEKTIANRNAIKNLPSLLVTLGCVQGLDVILTMQQKAAIKSPGFTTHQEAGIAGPPRHRPVPILRDTHPPWPSFHI